MAPALLCFMLGAGVGAYWVSNKNKRQCKRAARLAQFDPAHPDTAAAAQSSRDWEAQRTRIHERVVDLSEATLDAVLVATESLKAKIAEHKALKDAESNMSETHSPASQSPVLVDIEFKLGSKATS